MNGSVRPLGNSEEAKSECDPQRAEAGPARLKTGGTATTETDLDSNLNDESTTAGAVVSGFAFRGVISRPGHIVWSCPHTHFTEHSAKACASGHLQRSERDAPANVSAL